jgi:hypothetical protein
VNTDFVKTNKISILKPKTVGFTDFNQLSEVGRDERGDIIYADYSNLKSKDLIAQMVASFRKLISADTPINFGVSLDDNEISNEFCVEDCYTGNQKKVKDQLVVIGNN